VIITKGIALFVPIVLAGTLAGAAGPVPGAAAAAVHLKAISGRANGKGVSIVIEASEPAAYMTTQPDPLTVDVDFRNVGSAGVTNRFAIDGKSPIAGVAVETSESMGAPISRVRITLAQAVAHRVRADRNTIVVDFDKAAGGATSVLPPVSRNRPDAMAALDQGSGSRPDALAALGLTQPASARTTEASELRPGPAGTFGAGGGLAAIAAAARAPVAQAFPQAGQAALAQAGSPLAQTDPLLAGGLLAQAGAPAPPVAGQIGPPPAQRRFTGSPVSLDFQGADLRAVLRTFAEVSGLNLVIDPAVQGTVDVQLRDVPWDQALDIILRANKLGYIVDGTIVRIAPLTALADEEAQRRKLTDEQALAGELRVVTKMLSYAKAEEMQLLLTKSALSSRGTVQVDPRTNTLIISDLAERIQIASDLIATLDHAQPQVEIEARIVRTTKDYARQLGVQWGFGGRVSPQLGNTTNLSFPNNGSLSGATGATTGSSPTAVGLGVRGATSAVGLALGSLNGAFNLDVQLSALEASGNGRILSTPKVTTQNNVAAEMTQGVQIPIQTVSNNTVTVSFKDAALTLKVTPQITAANTVIMQIAVENSAPDFSRAINNIPPIDTQRALTTLLVADGMTTVIGGIYLSEEQTTNDRTPGLSRVPLLKWLFKKDTLRDNSSELLIFITPRIIKEG
jgi:type IV pilus assembly protein PilQ